MKWVADVLNIYWKIKSHQLHQLGSMHSWQSFNYGITSHINMTTRSECTYQWMNYEKNIILIFIYWFLVDLFKLTQSLKGRWPLEALIFKFVNLRSSEEVCDQQGRTPQLALLTGCFWEAKWSSLRETHLSHCAHSPGYRTRWNSFSSPSSIDQLLPEVFSRLPSSQAVC